MKAELGPKRSQEPPLREGAASALRLTEVDSGHVSAAVTSVPL